VSFAVDEKNISEAAKSVILPSVFTEILLADDANPAGQHCNA
jgi:hypothetical protein